MAADISALLKNLDNFYDFSEKKVISVGAGGGHLIEYAQKAAVIHAVDSDAQAMDSLREVLKTKEWQTEFNLYTLDFMKFQLKAELVFFEFSLHEMPDPGPALQHAFTLADEVLLIDHYTGSKWAYIASEEKKTRHAWEEINKFPMIRHQIIETLHSFHTFDELYEKVKTQGKTSVDRIERFRNQTDFTIPMTYALALLRYAPAIAT